MTNQTTSGLERRIGPFSGPYLDIGPDRDQVAKSGLQRKHWVGLQQKRKIIISRISKYGEHEVSYQWKQRAMLWKSMAKAFVRRGHPVLKKEFCANWLYADPRWTLFSKQPYHGIAANARLLSHGCWFWEAPSGQPTLPVCHCVMTSVVYGCYGLM